LRDHGPDGRDVFDAKGGLQLALSVHWRGALVLSLVIPLGSAPIYPPNRHFRNFNLR
jgi:hypothetical protein